MLVVIAILLVSQALEAAALGGKNVAAGEDLAALCAGKPIDLVSIGQLQILASNLDKPDGSACTTHTKNALTDLWVLLERDWTDVCTMSKVDHIKDYYSVYLDTSVDKAGTQQTGTAQQTGSQRSQIPKPLERFFLAYVMQISSHCKLHMMRVLFEKGVNPLSDPDFNELDEWTRDDGPISNLLDAIGKKDEILLPGDLVAVMPDKTLIKKLTVQTSASDKIKRAKEVCSKRFKPIYEPVVTPVAALSRAGFDLPDVLLKIHKPEKLEVLYEGMNKWSRVIFLCEALDLVETAKEELGVKPRKPVVDQWPSLDQIVCEPEPSGSIGNWVITSYDSKLKRLIKSFNTSKSEFERTSDKLTRRTVRLLKSRLKHGEYLAMFKLAFGKLTSKVSPAADAEKHRDRGLELINREIADAFEPKKESQASKALARTAKPIRRYAQSIVGLMTVLEVLKEYPDLSFKDIDEARNDEKPEVEQ